MHRTLLSLWLAVFAMSAATIDESARSILAANCLPCHGEPKMGGLDLRAIGPILQGGIRGPAQTPGKSATSLLYLALERTGDLKMPPGKQGLPPHEIRVIRDWIESGAHWPREDTPAASAALEPAWWSLRKPIRPAPPELRNAAIVPSPVDRFILNKLEARGLKPAPGASKLTLIRRAAFDLTGLPPEPAQVAAFLKDDSPKAWENLIDRLLASPQYGEKWGRHWLDVIRYGDSSGYEGDLYYPNAWRYRDYVIKSFNTDKPYDQFVKEQIAGDEIWPNTLEFEGSYIMPAQKQIDLEHRLGTSLYTIGPMDPSSLLNGEQMRYERLTDMADTTASAFLGLTMGCARCHDHKFDPITQKDYFALQAIFAGSEPRDLAIDVRKWQEFKKGQTKLLALEDLQDRISRLDQAARRRLQSGGKQSASDLAAFYTEGERAERERLLQSVAQVALKIPRANPAVTVLAHSEIVPDIHLAIRGEFRNKGPVVKPGFPAVLSASPVLAEVPGQPLARRKALALWLTRPDHPLTARVMVNRIWQGHFGRGIVATPNDFGRQGDPPSHPELLDWLATEFVARNWSVKAMHRVIMNSEAYRRSSDLLPPNSEKDPDNHLLWGANRRRLDAEGVRDAILATAGTLNRKGGGPPVIPPLSDEEIGALEDASQWPASHDPAAAAQRSVYLYVKRGFRIPMLETFDMPDASFSSAHRDSTNVAPQALALLNNDFVYRQAQAFASRLSRESADPAVQAASGWRLALGREPTPAELQKAVAILSRGAFQPGQPLLGFCLMLFNLNEFLYVD